MKSYKVKVNGNIIDTQKARVSAVPLNRVWTGVQRVKEQTEEAYFVSFDLLGKSAIIDVKMQKTNKIISTKKF